MTTRIYSLPSCQMCRATKQYLDKRGHKYEAIELADAPDDADRFRRLGLMQAPIVEHGDMLFSGFNPLMLDEIVKIPA